MMEGKILGYNIVDDKGVIKGDDDKRYYFSEKDFMNKSDLKVGAKVDFIAKKTKATEIFAIKGEFAIPSLGLGENTNIVLGLASLGLTFFLGFIGTFLSRVVISKHEMGEAMPSTLIHLGAAIVAFIIPFIGKIIYFGVTAYYMYQNYILVSQNDSHTPDAPQNGNKYEQY